MKITIKVLKRYFQKSGNGKWFEYDRSERTLSREQFDMYRNNRGKGDRYQCCYTGIGFVPYRITTTSPDKRSQIVNDFEIVIGAD